MGVADAIPLIDQHCHGVAATEVDPRKWLSEAKDAGRDRFASLLGLAVRRWCAPVLDLPPHAPAGEYLRRRTELGWRVVTERLLRTAGVAHWFVDTGYAPGPTTSPAELAALGGGRGHEVARIETIAESLFPQADSPARLVYGIRAELAAADAVAFKTVVGYRTGLGLPATAPTDEEAAAAAQRWLRAGETRLTDPVLLAWLVHEAARCGAERGLPLQFHTGFGDTDLTLSDVDPVRLTDFLRATTDTGLTVVLLHCWPFHRNAAYLAHVFGHVFVDIGLTIPFTGTRAGEVLAETLELAPFDAVLYSSDGNVLPELHHLGAVLWRRHLNRLLDSWLSDDVLTTADAEHLAHNFGAGNAARIHGLSWPPPDR